MLKRITLFFILTISPSKAEDINTSSIFNSSFLDLKYDLYKISDTDTNPIDESIEPEVITIDNLYITCKLCGVEVILGDPKEPEKEPDEEF